MSDLCRKKEGGFFTNVFVLAIIVYFLLWVARTNKDINSEFDKTHKAQLEAMAQNNRTTRNRIRGHMEPKTDPFVNLVKNGVLKLDRSVSVGDALDEYEFLKKQLGNLLCGRSKSANS